MPELTFAQPARRNLAAPLLGALALLALAAGLLYSISPHKTADVTLLKLTVYPAHTVFAKQNITNGTQVLGQSETTEDDLYLVVNLRIQNRLNTSINLDNVTGTLTNPDDSVFQATAAEKQQLPMILNAFPALKPIADPPLLRDTTIAPGQSATGTLILQYPVPKSTWEQRKSATVTLHLYHQNDLTLTLPKP